MHFKTLYIPTLLAFLISGGIANDIYNSETTNEVLKRTCLQRNTNKDEQKSCEFHPDEISFNDPPFYTKGNQLVKSFTQMKKCTEKIENRAMINFPNSQELQAIKEFPNALEGMDGKVICKKEEWSIRRDELKQMIQYYEYGFLPPVPDNVIVKNLGGGLIFEQTSRYDSVRLEISKKVNIDLQIYRPLGEGPFPVIVAGDLCWGSVFKLAKKITDRGYAIIEFDRTDVDEDNSNRLDGLHAMYPDLEFGTLMAWAWAYMRVIDYVESDPTLDDNKIIATGHSRGGKTALLAGALDERIALVNPNCSGIGGAGPNRFVITGETIDDITDPARFHYWFNKRFLEFRNQNVLKLPFDQHELIALVAPRAYLSTNALGDPWANPEGTQLAHKEAEKIFQFLEAGNKIQINFREGEHEQNEVDWKILIDFSDEIFFDKPAHQLTGYYKFHEHK